MKKIRLLCLTCLLVLFPVSPAWTFDAGGDDGGSDDGGFDDGGSDDEGDDQDEGENHDEGDRHDGDGGGHHHDHRVGNHHHGGGGLGPGFGLLGFGPGFGYGGGYGFMQPFYAYPPLMARPAPPVYIQQQNSGQPAPDSQSFWHYCRTPEGYYPEVRDCPDGWQQVAPQPAAPQSAPQATPDTTPTVAPQLPQDNQG